MGDKSEIRITCQDEGEMLAVLSKLQMETAAIWMDGSRPTEYTPRPEKYPIHIMLSLNDMKLTWRLTWDEEVSDSWDLEAAEYLHKDLSTKNIEPVPADCIAVSDPVNHPSHYTQGKVECIDAMEQALGTEVVKGFCLGNTFKYLWRHTAKNGQEDVEKAVWYFDRYKQILNR